MAQIANLLTILGISLTVVGAIILYRFGPPAMPITDGMQVLLVQPSTEEERERNRREEKRQIRCARLGLFLTVFGCSIQIFAVVLSIYAAK